MIKFLKRPKLKNTILIAAWPGMGSVALKAATFLKDKLRAKEFARIDPTGFFYHTDIVVEQGQIRMPEMPAGKFFWHEDKLNKRSIVFFISDAQVSLERGYDYAQKVMDIVDGFDVKKIFTFAAMPMPVDHFHKPEVWIAASHRKSIEDLKRYKIKTMSKGNISGLNGLFLGVAKERNVSGVCLLGEIPLYTIQIENPKASLAILEKLASLLNIKINLGELRIAGKLMEEEIEKLIDYIKTSPEDRTNPIDQDEIEKIKNILSAQTRIPESAKKNIEELFFQTKKDISKATELKKELDKWNVYHEYEDRFLDLFRKRDN